MRAISLFFAVSCVYAETIMGGSAFKDGFSFRYETRIEPDLPNQKITGFGAGGIVTGARFHRYMTDATSHRYFGYDLTVDPAGGAFRISFYPLSLTAAKLELNPRASWTLIPLPRLPEPQLVRTGDTLALDLFVHPVTGQKVTDYLFIGDNRISQRLPEGPARDYTLNDVPITLSKPRLTADGKPIDKWDGAISGTEVFYYIPGAGRYVFSLAPHSELSFRRNGEIRGARLTFSAQNQTYVVDCDGPIAPGDGAFHLYLHHDPAWKPRDAPDAPLLGATTRNR